MISNLTQRNKICSHKIITEKLTKKSRAYFYCYKCGKLIIVKDLKIYETLNQGKLEFNPIKMISQMLIKQEENIKTINEKYNKNGENNKISDIYIKKRNIFILYLNQLCNKMNYTENTFYNCLYLLDSYLIYILKKDISKRTIVLILLGFFLISSKFIENDIFEPNVNQFCKIDKDIVISQKEILNMEIKSLQIINYNMVHYSTYDWLKILNKIGVIFNVDGANHKKTDFFEKQKYILKRIIYKDILYKYDSFKIALSIIHISMDNIFLSNRINKDLFTIFLSIFNYKFSDYEQCYIEIKNIIFNYYDYNTEKNNDTNSNNIYKESEIYKTESNRKRLNNCYNKSVQNILNKPIQLSYINNTKINKSHPKKIFLSFNDLYKNKNNSQKLINILRNKTDEEKKEKNQNSNDNNNKKDLYKLNDMNSLILPKNKLLFKKEKQHLTIDCNNIETIRSQKKNTINVNYNNVINYLLKKTKKNNNSHRSIFNNTNYANNTLSRNDDNNNNPNNNDNKDKNNNNDKDIIKKNHTGTLLIKNEFKKSLTSLSNSPLKKTQNVLRENKYSLLHNLSNFKNKNKNTLKMLNIDRSNKNKIKNNNIDKNINNTIKTFYNKNPVKTLFLNKDIFYSLKEWKKDNTFPLRNINNNFINSKINKNIIINKEIISPYIKNELMNLSNN